MTSNPIKINVETVMEKLKMELGNLVFQLAVKETLIKQLKDELTNAKTDHPAGNQ